VHVIFGRDFCTTVQSEHVFHATGDAVADWATERQSP
jgi:hypothetical protein